MTALPKIEDMFAYANGDQFIGYSEGYPYMTPHWGQAQKYKDVTSLIDYVSKDVSKMDEPRLICVKHTVTVIEDGFVMQQIREQALTKLSDVEKRALGLS